MKLTIEIMKGSFTVHRLSPDTEIPQQVIESTFTSVTRTSQETSVVCPSSLPLNSTDSEPGWSCLMVLGPLDFSLTGILANISGYLAVADISIFAISTFDTDYILIKSENLEKAAEVLQKAGYTIKAAP